MRVPATGPGTALAVRSAGAAATGAAGVADDDVVLGALDDVPHAASTPASASVAPMATVVRVRWRVMLLFLTASRAPAGSNCDPRPHPWADRNGTSSCSA